MSIPSFSKRYTDTESRLEARGVRLSRDSAANAVLDEKTFTTMLAVERKRAERSGRKFVLALVDATALLKSSNEHHSLDQIVHTLSHSTRETDIKGWYQEGSVFGIIFTEIGPAERKMVARALLRRITDAICSTIAIDELHAVRVSFHIYPETHQAQLDLSLYPDQRPSMDVKRVSRVLKRAVDILGSSLGLIATSPLFLVVALAIKLTSHGPILFRQQRIGRYGTRFTFLKFRSMYMDNDDTIHKEFVRRFIAGQPGIVETVGKHHTLFKLTADPRITRIGGLLRRSSLDELPQLLNVLSGEMSLVGPRPPLPYEVERYEAWHKGRLLKVKPGITGLWQVNGRSRVKFDEMVRLDLKYADTWSLWLDLKLLWRTPAAVISGQGAC